MESETAIQERVERSRSNDLEFTLVDTNPVVIQVYSNKSDRIHTVVPQSVHCSCEDHTYRGAVCYHIIALLDADGHIGDLMQESIKEHRADVEKQANEVKDRLDDLLFQQEQITAVLSELGIDQDLERTDEDAMEMLASGVAAGDAAVVPDEEAEDLTDEESRDEFEQLVGDLTEGDA